MSIAIDQTYELNATPADVFTALTDPETLVKWWPTSATSDPVTGGAFEYVFKFEDASHDGVHDGTYTEVSESRIVYPWDAGYPTTVEFTIEGSGDKTTLRLNHTGYQQDEIFEQTSQGWSFFLGNLKTWIEDGKDMRVEVLGQKIAS